MHPQKVQHTVAGVKKETMALQQASAVFQMLGFVAALNTSLKCLTSLELTHKPYFYCLGGKMV